MKDFKIAKDIFDIFYKEKGKKKFIIIEKVNYLKKHNNRFIEIKEEIYSLNITFLCEPWVNIF